MPLRVLVTAYDISPIESQGSFRSGATDGWNLVEQLSRFCEVSVLTHSGNHESILESLSHGSLPQVRFHFVDPPAWQNRFPENRESWTGPQVVARVPRACID